jgi:hypothetical protein
MSATEMLRPDDLDVAMQMPNELRRIMSQGLTKLVPWHIMDRELAKKRMSGMRTRYRVRYVPFARRQDNDDVACFDPDLPGQVVVVHDFAGEGTERHAQYSTFWDWFRSAIEDMIAFE